MYHDSVSYSCCLWMLVKTWWQAVRKLRSLQSQRPVPARRIELLSLERKDKALIFDAAAGIYGKIRPCYAGDLFRTIFAYQPVGPESHVLEIGPGAGNATLPFLHTGCCLAAIEPGQNFAAICRKKFKACRQFSIIKSTFENADLQPVSFDLVFSATAFHWIEEETGYCKVFAILKKGGAFARFRNHPWAACNSPKLRAALDDIYSQFFHSRMELPASDKDEQKAAQLANLAARYGFTDIRHALFHKSRSLSAKEYVLLLGTYSDHLAVEKTKRQKLFNRIGQAIEKHGGTIRILDTMDLQLARKPL